MRNPKTLLVYYSRTGTTHLVAEAIAAVLHCDIEEIVDTKDRRGLLGFLRALFDASRRTLTTLKPTRYDPANYDLVIVGTPVWNASVSIPVGTYLTMHRGRLRNVAFFCTFGGRGSRRALQQMTDACGMKPLDVLAITEGAVRRGEHTRQVQCFVGGLVETRAAA